MDSKKVIEKLIRIAENQQKIITKLAQFVPSGLAGDPLDPTLPGGESSTAPTHAPTSKAPSASPDVATKGGLPADVKSAFDKAVPNLRGNLLVTVNGKDLNVAFNADRVKDRPTDLKKKIEGALGGAYTVSNIIGHMNPAWKPNY